MRFINESDKRIAYFIRTRPLRAEDTVIPALNKACSNRTIDPLSFIPTEVAESFFKTVKAELI